MEAFSLGSIVAHIKADTKEFTAGLEEAKTQADGFAGKLSTLAVGAGAVADAIVIGIGIKSIKAFSESQDLIAQTNAVLKSTGGVAGVTAKMVDGLSKSWESQTKYSDEAVRGAENILLTFTNIHKDAFPKATSAVLNMSTALHEDLQSASIQVGKALQDPVNGITALRRVGVNFTDDQKKVIKQLVDTGQSAKAQQIILAELDKEFGGSAKAAGDTYSGALAKLKNKFDDIEEIIGGKLLASLTNTFNWYEKHQRIVNDVAGVLGTLLGVIAVALILYGNWIILTKALVVAQTALKVLFIENPIMGAILLIAFAAALVVEHWKDVKKWFNEFIKDLESWFRGVTSDIKQWWKDVATFVTGIWKDIKSAIKDVLDWFGNRIQDVTGFLEKHKKVLTDIAIVIGTILLPAFVKMAAQAAISAAQTVGSLVAAFAVASASATASAATTTAAWVVSAARSIAAWIVNLPSMLAGFAVASAQAAVSAARITASFVVSAAQTTAAWVVAFARFTAGMVIMVAEFLVQTARMALGWMLALGPIGLIAAAIIGITLLIINNWNTVVNWFKGLGAKIKGAVGDVGNLLYDVGKSIIQGLINGVKDMARDAENAVKSVTNGIKDTAKKVLGVFSPSMVFHEIGMNVGQGLINGMNSMTNMIGQSSAGLAMAAIAPASSIVNNASSSVNTTISGPINIGSNVDANQFLARLTYNQELAQKGLTPVK